MAIRKDVDYPGRWLAATTAYPLGEPKNRTTSASKDGSYLEKKWIQDYEAFFGALLNDAEVSPNGTVDTAEASQFFDAFKVASLNAYHEALRNRTLQDLTLSRSQGVEYTNDTSTTIRVIVSTTNTGTVSTLRLRINGVTFSRNGINNISDISVINYIDVEPGDTYEVLVSGDVTPDVLTWFELR